MGRLCHASSGNALDIERFMPNILSLVEKLFSRLVVKVLALIGNFLIRLGYWLHRFVAAIGTLAFAGH